MKAIDEMVDDLQKDKLNGLLRYDEIPIEMDTLEMKERLNIEPGFK